MESDRPFNPYTTASITEWFRPRTPTPKQGAEYVSIHDKGREFALLLDSIVPDSYEKTMALDRVQEAVQWCEAAIARHAGECV